MALPDEVVFACLRLCTRVPLKKIQEMEKDIKIGKLYSRDAKSFLARENVEMYHGAKQAKEAQEEFVRVFQKKQLPSKIKKVKKSDQDPRPLYEIIGELFAISRSEAKRVIKQGGVKIDSVIQKDPGLILKLRPKMVIQIGKRRTLQII